MGLALACDSEKKNGGTVEEESGCFYSHCTVGCYQTASCPQNQLVQTRIGRFCFEEPRETHLHVFAAVTTVGNSVNVSIVCCVLQLAHRTEMLESTANVCSTKFVTRRNDCIHDTLI